MSFERDVLRFADKAGQRASAVFVNVAAAVKDSVVYGSPVTGSPGQPVDTGNLRSSFQVTFDSPTVARISTNVEYAPLIEDNIRGARLRSTVGGFHSAKQTIAGFPRLQEAVNREVPA